MSNALRNQDVTTSWATLPDVRGHNVGILNSTGADLFVSGTADTGDSSKMITLADGQSVSLQIAENANEVSIKADAGAAGVNLVIAIF